MQTLIHLAKSIGFSETQLQNPNLPITDIAYNSKNAAGGVLFVCLVGAVTDGHRYASDAYLRGSRVFVVEKDIALPEDAVILKVENTRRALALLSAEFFDHPEKKIKVIGVTGTKGKSTIAEMIRHILEENGIPAASVGTVGVRIGERFTETANTTPESYELFRIFSDIEKMGIRHAVIEVSSQGVKLDRIYGIPFHIAVMTNLSEDHIGDMEHPTFEDYKECKKELFRRTNAAVFNADDDYFEEFSVVASVPAYTYSTSEAADFSAKAISPVMTENGFATSFILESASAKTEVILPFPGKFSVSNALAAIAVSKLLGIHEEKAAEALATATVKGRFERIATPIAGVTFVIDYAHNGESLSAALRALRAYAPNRLICLFGSVGGRTEIRRRELGIAAAEYADFSILTDDNPNRESSADIIRDIEKHMNGAPHISIPDRKEAIEYAVSMAKEGDIVLFAGKGHENYQLIDGKKLPFSEKDLILAAADKISISKI